MTLKAPVVLQELNTYIVNSGSITDKIATFKLNCKSTYKFLKERQQRDR